MTRRALLLAALLAACSSNRGNGQLPFVQPSSPGEPTLTITVTERGNLTRPCLLIDLGATVEWHNPTGRPFNVTSASVRGAPPELFSPNLVGSAVRWRHTFQRGGRVDYFNQGAGGGAIDPYYGTRIAGGGSTGGQGTICVGGGCDALCCNKGEPRKCPGSLCVVVDDPEVGFGFCGAGATSIPDAAVHD